MESVENIDFLSYWCILKRRWLPAVAAFGSVVVLTYVSVSLKVPMYRAQGQLLFRQDETSSLIGLNSAKQVDSQSDKEERVILSEERVILSTHILQKALYLINRNNPQTLPLKLRDLQRGLEIKNIEGTDILQVAYAGKDPELAALVVNQLMNVYADNALFLNRAATISVGNFITMQLPRVKANVERADVAVRSFKEKYKITDLTQTQASVAANIERIGTQIDLVKTQLADLNARSTVLQNKLGMIPQQAMAVSALNQSPAVQGILTDLQEIQRKLAEARSIYKESHPVVVDLKAKEAQVKNLLQAQAAQVLQGQKTGQNGKFQVGTIQQELMADLLKSEVIRKGLVTQLDTLSDQQAFYQQKAAILPRLEKQQREQQRELSVAQSTYEELLKNLQEVKIIENRTVGNVQIIEAAQVPAEPTTANKILAMAVGSIAGILIAIAFVYMLEVRDKKIKTVKEARELFEYTLLGMIPVFDETYSSVDSVNRTSKQRGLALPVIEMPRSSISESYRMIQSNLKCLNSDKVSEVIVVTSSVPKEGKSTTCANLAAVMAQLGYSVLIIDADIHRPSQHQIWQISNQVGLIDIIAKQGELGRAVIQRVMKNLDVLTAGVSNSKPHVFLNHRSMADLIKHYPNQYDYVLIDTPPLTIAADAAILGNIADGVILVTRPGLADSINSKLAKEYLDRSGQNILGIVVNGVIPENEPYSYHFEERAYEEKLGFRKPTPTKKKNWLDKLRLFKSS